MNKGKKLCQFCHHYFPRDELSVNHGMIGGFICDNCKEKKDNLTYNKRFEEQRVVQI